VIRPASAFFDILSGGKSILYGQTDPQTKQWGGLITRIEVATGQRTILKRSALHERLAEINVSPDGRLVAYVRLNELTSQSYMEVMPVEGGDSRVVFHARDWAAYFLTHGIAWTPDQRYLVFVRGWNVRPGGFFRRALVKVPVEGGEADEIGIALEGGAQDTFAFPSFSADGRHLVYTKQEGPQFEVRVMENFLRLSR
jgi:Tol biopolymer transport system component